MKGPQSVGITKELLKCLYVDNPNASLESVGKSLGVHRETLRRWIKYFELPLKSKFRPNRPRKGHDKRLANAEWMFEQLKTKTSIELGEEIEVNYSVILYWAHKHGIIDENKSISVKRSLKKKFPKGRFGKNHPNWKGGKNYLNGYIRIYYPNHPNAVNGYIFEHRLMMEKQLGRYLERNEVIHHLNGIKDDNRIENLQVIKRGTHVSNHFKASHEVLKQRKRIQEIEEENKKLKEEIKKLRGY